MSDVTMQAVAPGGVQQEGERQGGGSPSANGVTEDDLFTLLSNRRRRFAVHLLKHENQPVEIGEMATKIAAWENNIAENEVTGKDRKRVYTALQQSHLPTMDDAGIVSFNKERGIIDPEPALEDIELYLDIVRGDEIPWSEYYLGLAAIGMAILAAAWINVWPFILLPDLAWGVFLVTALLVSAIAHRIYMRGRRLGARADPPEV